MKLDFIVCNGQGVILRKGRCPECDFAGQAVAVEGEHVVKGSASDENDYIDPATHEILPKKKMAPVIDAPKRVKGVVATIHKVATIRKLPLDATVTVNRRDTFNLPGGDCVLELEDLESGLYEVTVQAPTYHSKILTFNVP